MAKCPHCEKEVSILRHYFNFENLKENLSRYGVNKIYNCDKCSKRFMVDSKSSIWFTVIIMGIIFAVFLIPSYLMISRGGFMNPSTLKTVIILAAASLLGIFTAYYTWWRFTAKLIKEKMENE